MTTTEAPPKTRRRRHTIGDLFHERTRFQFIERSWRWALLSGTFLLISIIALAVSGLNLGIDFTGGLSYTVTVTGTAPTVAGVRAVLDSVGEADAQVSSQTTSGGAHAVQVEAPAASSAEQARIARALARAKPGFDVTGGVLYTITVNGTPPTVSAVRTVLRSAGTPSAQVSLPVGVTGARLIQVQIPAVSSAEQSRIAQSLSRFGPESRGLSYTVTAKAVPPTVNAVRSVLRPIGQSDAAISLGVNRSNGVHSVEVQTPAVSSAEQSRIAAALARYGPESGVESVSPTWGSTVTNKAALALVVFFILIALYLSFRFEWRMALAAILAVIHDILVTVGVYAVTGFQVVPATVIAFLTILGFSLYDTVVVFDKVLENTPTVGTDRADTYSAMVNRSLNQVLMRSLNTSFVAVLPVASLVFVGSGIFGAAALKDFALALFVGLSTGAYSSIFIAAPILAWVKEREPKYRAVRERAESQAAKAARGQRGDATPVAVAAVPAATSPDAAGARDRPAPAARPDPSASPTATRPGVPPGVVAPRPRQQRRRKRR